MPPVYLQAPCAIDLWRFLSGSGAGALRSCDPDRLVLKKVVLSGYPVKVHKSKAVVRWMFHSPEDIRWFRPLELWTKHGRRGRIKVGQAPHDDGPCRLRRCMCALLSVPHALCMSSGNKVKVMQMLHGAYR